MLRLAVLYAVLFVLFLLLPTGPDALRLDLPTWPAEQSSVPVQLEEPPEVPIPKQAAVAAEGDAQSGWVESGNPESIPLLVHYLRDRGEVAQRGALAEFAVMGAEARSAVPAILGALRDPKSSTRVEAAATLIHMDVQSKVAVRTLTQELTAEGAADRAHAAWMIGQLVDPPKDLSIHCWGPGSPPRVLRPWVGKQTWSAVVVALEDSDPKVRAQAAQTLGMIGHAARTAVPARAQALKDEAAAVREAAGMGKRTTSALIQALKDRAAVVRAAAATALGLIGSQEQAVVRALVVALEDNEAEVRAAAAVGLGSQGRPALAAVPALVRALKDRDQRVALAAAQALKRLDADIFVGFALPVLIEIVRDKQSRLRETAVNALKDLGPHGRSAVPVLCELLKDQDAYVRWAAAYSLAMGPEAKAAVVPLTVALKDSDDHVRWTSTHALSQIDPEAAAVAVPALTTALTDPDETVRCKAADALGEVGPKAEAAVPALLQAMKDKDEYVAAKAAIALGHIGANADVVVPALVAALADERREVRAYAASGLGVFGARAKTAVPALIEGLKHFDWEVLRSTAWALKGIDPDGATSTFIEALNDKSEDVRRCAALALGLIDAEAKSVPALIRVLREDASVRYDAVWSLGEMRAKARDAVPALVETLRDEDKGLRAQAAWALKKIGTGTLPP